MISTVRLKHPLIAGIQRSGGTVEKSRHSTATHHGQSQLWWSFEKVWWSQTGSNRRPPACKAGALPAELWPLNLHRICARAIWRSARQGRFICQCAALVNPFLTILKVFSAAGSLSGKYRTDSDQICPISRC